MSFPVALLLLLTGIALGYRLPGPVARLKAAWRRRRYKPTLLKPFIPDAPDQQSALSERRNDA